MIPNMSLALNMSPWLAVLDKRQSVEWEAKGLKPLTVFE